MKTQKKTAFTLAEGTPCIDICKGIRRYAFTLAEVLITLGIIGVVAAITIPALMTTINTKVREHKITVFKAKLKQGMDLLNTSNGIGPYYQNSREFVEALSKHMKIVTICDNNELNKCMGYDKIIEKTGKTKNVNDFKTGVDFGLITDDTDDYSSDNVGIILGDGTPMLINYNLKCPVSDPDSRNDNSTACISGLYDINGPKSPNKKGEDVLSFNWGWGKIFTVPPLTYNECMSLKDKLGIKDCCPLGNFALGCQNADYWAGAVKTCGGVQNMPSMTQLRTLAGKLYRKIDNGDGTYTSIFDSSSSAAKAIGVTSPPWFWSRDAYSVTQAYSLRFTNNEAVSDPRHRYTVNLVKGICLSDE